MMKRIVISMLSAYHRWSTAIGRQIPFLTFSGCRQYPTCSAYGVSAIETYGVGRGLRMTFMRILRCNPLFSSH